MKTYKQFNQDINENVKAWLGKAWKFTRPLKTLDRIDNVNVIRNKNANEQTTIHILISTYFSDTKYVKCAALEKIAL